MTVTESALFSLITFGVAFLASLIFIAWKYLRSWKAYLPFIDLLSYTMGGLTLALALWNGTISFNQTYPVHLSTAGLTNTREPYLSFYDEITVRRDDACAKNRASNDCAVLRDFIRRAIAEMNGEFFMRRVPIQLPASTSAGIVRLISSYNNAFDTVPRPIDVMADALQKIGGLSVVILLFAWMLGVHRRWIVFNQARR